MRECEGDVTGAAAKVERAVARLYLRKFDDVALPIAVQAEALEVVQKIITPSDAGEEVVNLGGAVAAGGIKLIAHGDSLTATVAQGKAEKFLCAGRRLC